VMLVYTIQLSLLESEDFLHQTGLSKNKVNL